MVGVVADILGLKGGCRLRELGAGVADFKPVGRLGIRIARRSRKGLDALLAVEPGRVTWLGPGRAAFNELAGREGRPRGFSDDADAIWELHHLDDARNLDLGVV